MKNTIIILFFSLLCCSCMKASAQTEADTSLILIETIDGNRFTGQVKSEDSEKIVLLTPNLGEIIIRKTDIKSLKQVLKSQVKEGQVWFDNPQSSRYFWAPNGYGLKQGEGYYQNIWVLWNQVAYGITD